MDIPVFIEPHPPGFRATTGAPLNLTAEGPTVEEARASLQKLVEARDTYQTYLRPMTSEDLATILDACQQLSQNPLFDEYLDSIEEFRRTHNVPPEVD